MIQIGEWAKENQLRTLESCPLQANPQSPKLPSQQNKIPMEAQVGDFELKYHLAGFVLGA